MNHPNRREAIILGLGSLGALAVGGCATTAPSGEVPRGRSGQRVARIAHVTDTHIMPERNAEAGVRRMWQQLAAERDRPDFIITGGDHIMHAMDQLKSRVTMLWEMWQRVKREECRFDVYPVAGNHDIWGWHPMSESPTSDPLYGKAWARQELGLERLYYRLPRTIPGWRVLVLDSVHPHPERLYQGSIDDEQFEWLKGELAAVPAGEHVLIATHIPIFSAAATMNGRLYREGTRKQDLDPRDIFMDAGRVLSLLDQYPQVQLSISGHLHQREAVAYPGPSGKTVTHLCNGAASGGWWRGPNLNTPQGYTFIDLYADGSWQHEYRSFEHPILEPDDMPARRST